MHVLNSPFHFILFLSTSPILFNYPYSFQLPRFLHNYPLLFHSTTSSFSFQLPFSSPFNFKLLLLSTTLFFSLQLPFPFFVNYPLLLLSNSPSFSFQFPLLLLSTTPYSFELPLFLWNSPILFNFARLPFKSPFSFSPHLWPSPLNLRFGLPLLTSPSSLPLPVFVRYSMMFDQWFLI